MSSHSRFGLAILAALCACAAPSLTLAQTAPTAPPASPSPAASSAPEAPSDPCDSLSNLVSRPSFTTSACAVKRDQVLLEAGYSNLSASGPGAVTLVNVPQGLFRMGVGHNIELDVAPPSLERQSGMPPIGGNSDAQFGLKYEFGYSPKVTSGMNVVYTAASGTAPFTGNGPGLLVNLNGALTLSPAVGLFGSLGYNSQGGGTAAAPLRYAGFDPSLGVGISLPLSLNFYAEGFGQSSTGPGLGGRFGFDTGFTRDFGPRLQLDVEYYDYAVQAGVHQHSIGFGGAYRIGGP